MAGLSSAGRGGRGGRGGGVSTCLVDSAGLGSTCGCLYLTGGSLAKTFPRMDRKSTIDDLWIDW